ncbi:MAG TPA: hypothetical protein VLH09_13190, partial [Bryobacteraceae bacterium]|nr:hypothetical protein [Bryobacteraceae bacterium]
LGGRNPVGAGPRRQRFIKDMRHPSNSRTGIDSGHLGAAPPRREAGCLGWQEGFDDRERRPRRQEHAGKAAR